MTVKSWNVNLQSVPIIWASGIVSYVLCFDFANPGLNTVMWPQSLFKNDNLYDIYRDVKNFVTPCLWKFEFAVTMCIFWCLDCNWPESFISLIISKRFFCKTDQMFYVIMIIHMWQSVIPPAVVLLLLTIHNFRSMTRIKEEGVFWHGKIFCLPKSNWYHFPPFVLTIIQNSFYCISHNSVQGSWMST